MANHPGDFIWYELMSPDAAASEAFYGPMLGWTFSGSADYRQFTGSEGGVGGILPLTSDMKANGVHPAWLGYILVEDVDKTVASISESGGSVRMPARDIDGIGRFAMIADPQGAVFYIMKPIPPADRPDMESRAFSYDRRRVGHCAWNELATSDPAAALRFYSAHFDWVKDGEMDIPPVGAYEFLRHAGRAPDGSPPGHGILGAMFRKPDQMPAPAWRHYFRVADIDEAVAHIEANGGTITMPPVEIPGGDFSLGAIDPQGAPVALVGSRKR